MKSTSYKKLIRDPLTTIRDIYQQFNYPWDHEKEKNISAWLAGNPQHKHGVHQYRLEDFGLTETDILDQFSCYFDQYGHLF